MSQHEQHHAPAPNIGVEPDTVDVRRITVIVALLVIVVVASAIGLRNFLDLETQGERSRKTERLGTQLAGQRQKEQKRLTSYGYDAEKKTWSMPIDVAMRHYVAQPDSVKPCEPPPEGAGKAPAK